MKNIFKELRWPFIRKSKIQKELDKARDDERNRANQRHSKEMKHLKNQHHDEKSMLIQFHNSKISSMEKEIAEMEKKVLHAEAVYFTAVVMSKNNTFIGTDLSVIAEEMIHESAKIYTKMREVVKRAKDNHKKIEEQKLDKLKLNAEQISLIENLTEMKIIQAEKEK